MIVPTYKHIIGPSLVNTLYNLHI